MAVYKVIHPELKLEASQSDCRLLHSGFKTGQGT